ncbi:MAG: SpoIVB peptidase [Clostridia bacterium]|nr:SpoIVB peptidase [Clostridia bacterium]
MKKELRKKLSFLLIGFFVFSYQFANFAPVYTAMVDASADSVILGGQSIGVNINVDGIMILGFSDFYGQDGKRHCPAKEAGLKEGDTITKINNEDVFTATDFSEIVDNCSGNNFNVEYFRNGKRHTTVITPVKSEKDGKYRLGLWARDGTTGMGTLTFVDPETKRFGALGHGVSDEETEKLIAVGKSNIYYACVSDIKKGSVAQPGELKGYFTSSEIGDITQNTNVGIFGEFMAQAPDGKLIATASRQEISTGPATIYCCVNGSTVEEFAVNIDKININSRDNKSMVIHITDERLLGITGGIVQGMSGSPIIQNGKLIGAVTHVFVNDPTRGYGIFIDNMLDAAG